ncbi:MAG: hypothetical protein GY943_30450 [Chloroflexi bacterium]|nr:hypothetical protein [Chloroflexota bacterium]
MGDNYRCNVHDSCVFSLARQKDGAAMINLNKLNKFRNTSSDVISHYGGTGDETCGVFSIISKIDAKEMWVIASAGGGWDHVSVSRRKRVPNWYEMEQVKRLFFEEHEFAMQLHVPSSDHVNIAQHCLHLWRPINGLIPLPPSIYVGPPIAGTA